MVVWGRKGLIHDDTKNPFAGFCFVAVLIKIIPDLFPKQANGSPETLSTEFRVAFKRK